MEFITVRGNDYQMGYQIGAYFSSYLKSAILPYIEEKRLDTWTHNKAIQKSVESYRITPEQKEYLKKLKIK